MLLIVGSAASGARGAPTEDIVLQPGVRIPQPAITTESAGVSNDILSVAIDLKHPSINSLRYSPQGNGHYEANVFQANGAGLLGIVTRIGKGVLDGPASNYSTSTTRAESFVNGAYAGVTVSNITDSDPDGKNPIARETWGLTLQAGNGTGVVWDRTVKFLRDANLVYSPLEVGDTSAPHWVDTVTLIRPDTAATAQDFNPLLEQIGGDVAATDCTSLSSSLDNGKKLEAGQIIANALRGPHRLGEEVHLRYVLSVVDTRSWFQGLPDADRKALIHAAWYCQVTKQWRGDSLTPGLATPDAFSREARWLSLEDSLPLAASLWSPHRALGADGLWWSNYDEWSVLGEGVPGVGGTESRESPGFLAYRMTDLGIPLPTPGFLTGAVPSTASFPIDVERLYAFTKNRVELARLAPRLRLAQSWIEAHPNPLFYGGAALQSLSRLYDQLGDAAGASHVRDELETWKKSLAASWNPGWLAQQDYGELTAMADYGLLTAAQTADVHALIVKYPESEIPPASPHLSEPRTAGNYATGLWATVFRAKSGDADRAYEMASAATARINANPEEPFRGFGADLKPAGASGYGPSAAVIGMFAWGIFGFEPSTEENRFELQPAIPSAWSGQTHSYRYEYALSSDFPASGVIITYTLHDKSLDTVFDFGGIRPGLNRLRFETGGKVVTVDGVLQGGDFLFHVTLTDGTLYHVQFLPSGLRPGPQFQTARATAPGAGMGLAPGQRSGVVEGTLADAGPVLEVGVNWDAKSPPGSFPVVFLSNDRGGSWEQVANGEAHLFAHAGTGLRYRIFLVRPADEDLRLRSLVVTYAAESAPAAPDLPAEAPAAAPVSDPAFLETFDTGLESAGEHDGGKRVYRDAGGSILGPGSLAVVSDPGDGDGSVWLAHNIGYDPAAYPFLDFWVQTRSSNYAAIWPEMADPGLVRDGLAYRTPEGKAVTPLLLLTAEAAVSPDLMTLGDLKVPADGRRFHVSFNLNQAITALFGPGPHRITGFRLVDYVDPGGSTYRFDEISARKETQPSLR